MRVGWRAGPAPRRVHACGASTAGRSRWRATFSAASGTRRTRTTWAVVCGGTAPVGERGLPLVTCAPRPAVGSIQSNTRTLYVGGLQRTEGQDLKEVVTRHFAEWGEVEVRAAARHAAQGPRGVDFPLPTERERGLPSCHRLRAVPSARVGRVCQSGSFCAAGAGVAPPTHPVPPPCPFAAAQIAMEGQSLDGDELLNVRWAHDDPNPVAKNAVRSPPALPLGQTVSCPRMTPLPCLSPMRLAPRSSARTRTPWWP